MTTKKIIKKIHKYIMEIKGKPSKEDHCVLSKCER